MGMPMRKPEIRFSVPRTLPLDDLFHERYTLSRTLKLFIKHGESGYVITEPKTGVFSYHPNFQHALEDFHSSFISDYEFLLQNRDNLSPGLNKKLEMFKKLVISR